MKEEDSTVEEELDIHIYRPSLPPVRIPDTNALSDRLVRSLPAVASQLFTGLSR